MKQIEKIESHTDSFAITHLGDTLIFVSNLYGIWIIWDNRENVKIGISINLEEKTDGLCGFFNGNPLDDKRKPDGTIAKTTVDFGDGWMNANELGICELKTCSVDMQNKALKLCNLVKYVKLYSIL